MIQFNKTLLNSISLKKKVGLKKKRFKGFRFLSKNLQEPFYENYTQFKKWNRYQF